MVGLDLAGVIEAVGEGVQNWTPGDEVYALAAGVFTLLPLLTGSGREHHGEILRQAAALIESGQLRPLLDPHRFTLETAGEAHELLATKAAQGRLVVEI